MLLNYIRIAYRNLVKNKIYTVINIIGLAAGITCCVLILLFVVDELSYDSFHENGDQLYRVALERKYPDHVNYYAVIPGGFAEVMENEIPEIHRAARLVGFPGFSTKVEYEDRVFNENYVFFADSNFLDLFRSFKIIQGDADAALNNPRSVILTESTARKYFGRENPVGKTIEMNDSLNTVTAVMQDIPENSHMKFDFLSSTTNVPFLQNTNYVSFSSYTYLELVDGASPEQVEEKMQDLVRKYASGQIEQRLGVSYEDYLAAGNGYNYFLQSVEDIHLHSSLENEIKANGSITYIYIFISIALFILALACINFVNLTTARSGERAKEVGVRKVMGSERSQLITQFLSESILISFVSLVIAIVLIQLILPFFNNLSGKTLELDLFLNSWFLFVILGMTLLVGVLAGVYPAIYISSLDPVRVMKGKFLTDQKGRWFRNGLVVFQFAISIVLITGTFVVFNQMDYMQNKRLGFEKENVLVVNMGNNFNRVETFQKEIENLPEVINAANSSMVPGGNFFGMSFRVPEQSDMLVTKGLSVGDHFIETMDMTIVEGRPFSEDFNDSLSVILNQSAVKTLGIENPVGQRLRSTINVNNESTTVIFTIVGIVEDFNFESLRTEITPLAIISNEGPNTFPNFVTIRFNTANVQQTVANVQNKWKEFAPDDPFVFSFLDDRLAQLYESERKSGQIIGTFSILAIIIACVGLFGLAAYMAFQRTKEIGIRKVLGATVPNIILLLSKDFTRLVLISFLVAVPVAYLLMNNWLQNFAYRINLDIQSFLLAGSAALLIAIVTISYQAVKAAVANPVNSLRNE